ncbi:MAG: tRNA adenosine deaminase [Propionibacteriaceae bacterium]|jgi:putative tRNA adenosine deaminase-associated protein|nr:tRNA adenosine deaminase [Propionibacteriaceae bacterium]
MTGKFDPEDKVDDRIGLEHVDPAFDARIGGHDDDFADDDRDDDNLEDDEDDDEDEDDEDDEDEDDLEDATWDDIDFVVGLYREDGQPVVVPLEAELANDLDALIAQLQRLPGDSGACGLVSINGEVLVAVSVRGPRHVHVMTSDIYYADVYPIVRDVADFFQLKPDDPETPEEGPAGDLGLFAFQGLREERLEALCLEDEELSSDELAEQIIQGIRFDADAFAKVIDEYWEGEDDGQDG